MLGCLFVSVYMFLGIYVHSLSQQGDFALTAQLVQLVTIRDENSTREIAELLAAGADGKAKLSENGESLLHLACIYENPEKVKLLLQSGADPNYRATKELNLLDMTPLSWCVYGGYESSVAELLKDERTDVNIVFYTEDGSFVTALDIALRIGEERGGKVAELLKRAGGMTFQAIRKHYASQDIESLQSGKRSEEVDVSGISEIASSRDARKKRAERILTLIPNMPTLRPRASNDEDDDDDAFDDILVEDEK